MGRVKLEIKKIQNEANRKITFAKRRIGLLKKAFELSKLCDIDIGLIIFSASGKLTHFANDDRMEELIIRFANTNEHERTKQKSEIIKDLHKVVQKLSNERGLEGSRADYEALQLQNQELLATIKRMNEEKRLYEQKTMGISNPHVTTAMEFDQQEAHSMDSTRFNLGGEGFPAIGITNLHNTMDVASSENPFDWNGQSGSQFATEDIDLLEALNTCNQESVSLPNQGSDELRALTNCSQGNVPLPNQGNGDVLGWD